MAEETGDKPAAEPTDLELPELEAGETTALSAAPAGEEGERKVAADLAPVFDVPVHISAVLGKTAIDVSALLQLSSGSVLELDRKVGEAIDIYVNNRLVARGEVVVVEERLGVTMTEIIKDGDSSN
ncbi:MAG: flagellar motor switch protein FliN [Caulobacterales bacterium]|nr:flagellar motor switch protein FliN [Caulobacterales bacterium]